MQLPASTSTALLNLTTGAANAASTGTLISAPGAGFRIRLWLVRAVNIQNAAAQVARVYVKESVTGTYRGVCSFTVGTTGVIDLAGVGGVAIGSANAVNVEAYDTLATQTLPVFGYYTLEEA